ncbi:MAG: hypothetical protein WEA34_14535 [Gemmatimonadota bacterium]
MTPNPVLSMKSVISIAAVALVATVACSGEPPEAQPDGPGTEPAPEAPAPETPTGPAEPATPTDPADTASWSIGITSAPSTVTAPPLPVLTALRAGTHPDYERVTFKVAGASEGGGATAVPAGRPGYKLEYVDRPLIACGSGDQIFPVGDGWLEIRLEPAAAHTEEGQPTLGPREVEVDGPLLQRIYRTCDFEGIVTHVLALGSPNEYRVFTLADPLRIVVDVRR